MVVFALVIVMAIVSIFWTPYSIFAQGLGDVTDPFSWKHPSASTRRVATS